MLHSKWGTGKRQILRAAQDDNKVVQGDNKRAEDDNEGRKMITKGAR